MAAVVAAVRRACMDYSSPYFPLLAGALVCGEACLGAAIILCVPYTEIDWEAYMDEVRTILAGDLDYSHSRGATGPLVYPGGFVGVYAVLFVVTGAGVNVRLAQWIFLGLYLATQAAAICVYRRANIAPPWTLALLCLSKRVHSIYMLRLFNDAVAALLALAAVERLQADAWNAGCVLYSSAVSVKMSALLYAPGLLFLLLRRGGLRFAARQIAICALVQGLVAAPFMATNPRAYLGGAFDLGRVFQHKWTVNLQFLPEAVFVSKRVALGLLGAHVACLVAFARWKWLPSAGGGGALLRGRCGRPSAGEIFKVMAVANFAGICFARTLHYQFYAWYFHSLPCLLWSARFPWAVRLLLLAGVDVVFSRFPPTAEMSTLLCACHLIILLGVFLEPDKERPGRTPGAKGD